MLWLLLHQYTTLNTYTTLRYTSALPLNKGHCQVIVQFKFCYLLESLSQLSTFSLDKHSCFNMSKTVPAGQRRGAVPTLIK